MTTIEEIIEDVRFVEWSSSEQQALNKMMNVTAKGHSTDHITNRTSRVMTTFLRILDTHLPEKEV